MGFAISRSVGVSRLKKIHRMPHDGWARPLVTSCAASRVRPRVIIGCREHGARRLRSASCATPAHRGVRIPRNSSAGAAMPAPLPFAGPAERASARAERKARPTRAHEAIPPPRRERGVTTAPRARGPSPPARPPHAARPGSRSRGRFMAIQVRSAGGDIAQRRGNAGDHANAAWHSALTAMPTIATPGTGENGPRL